MPPINVIVLGPQRLAPTLKDALADLSRAPGAPVAASDHYAVVTAGWEEREEEHQELAEHLGGRTTNMDLFRRADDVFERDPELADALRAHHLQLKNMQELYRVRLAHLLDAARTLLQRQRPADDPQILEEERTQAIEDTRRLDTQHAERIATLHREFHDAWRPQEREAVASHRAELGHVLNDSSALFIAGGNVLVLLNRLRLFDLLSMRGEQPVLCWSAGAMALAERVVVFHDHPPQGPGNAEVVETGLGLFRGLVPLPHASRRLRLDDPLRVGLFARRFGPAICAALDERTRIDWDGSAWHPQEGTRRLCEDGSLEPIAS